tara:strand:+ start:1146 stop:1355 length:210 start_codon:yes stop_codon:yes gene_type:complete
MSKQTKEEIKRYLVIYNLNSGIAELGNVGVFNAETEVEARKVAKKQWRTTASLYAIALDDCQDGWSWFT